MASVSEIRQAVTEGRQLISEAPIDGIAAQIEKLNIADVATALGALIDRVLALDSTVDNAAEAVQKIKDNTALAAAVVPPTLEGSASPLTPLMITSVEGVAYTAEMLSAAMGGGTFRQGKFEPARDALLAAQEAVASWQRTVEVCGAEMASHGEPGYVLAMQQQRNNFMSTSHEYLNMLG